MIAIDASKLKGKTRDAGAIPRADQDVRECGASDPVDEIVARTLRK